MENVWFLWSVFKICINLHSFTGTEYSGVMRRPSYIQSWYARLPDIGVHSFKRVTLFVLPSGSTKYFIKPMENWWSWCCMPDAHAYPDGCVCAATRGVCDRPRSEGIASVGSSNQLRGQPWDPRSLPLNQAKYRPKEQKRLDIRSPEIGTPTRGSCHGIDKDKESMQDFADTEGGVASGAPLDSADYNGHYICQLPKC